jgi:hypothetical protein
VLPVNAETDGRHAAAVATLTLYAAFKASDDGRVRNGSGLAWQYWADRLAEALALLVDMVPGPLEQLGAEAAARQLEQIRAVFDTFDWQTDDPAFALEAVQDIVSGRDLS